MNKSAIPPEFRRDWPKSKKQTAQELRADRLKSQDVFIKCYSVSGNITKSCKRADIDRSTYYSWMQDHEFAARVSEARESCIESADAELLRRGMDPKKDETRALVSWLRAHSPSLYGDKTKIQLVGNEEMVREIAEMLAANVTDPATYQRLREELRRIATA